MNKLIINTDGGSRGNPGPAGIGIVFSTDDGKEVYCCKECIGKATNNDAEYQAIIRALKILSLSKWFLENNGSDGEVICRLDSQLVVEQINGNYKVKQEHLKVYIAEIRKLISEMHLKISFVHIPREENKKADKLVNEALDEEMKK